MVDPISAAASAGGAIAQAVEAASKSGGEETGKVASTLLLNVFGPVTQSMGQALGRMADYRLGNVQRIAKAADRKSAATGRDGIVNPRVAHSLLDDGSWCDDEMMVEYFGGLLAAGRTPTGRDDRAVAWTSLLASMSAIEIRLHFILYREWAHALIGLPQSDVDQLAFNQGVAAMYVKFDTVVDALMDEQEGKPSSGDAMRLATQAVTGLTRRDLLDRNNWGVGTASKLPEAGELPFDNTIFAVPTWPGIELFGWACGMPGCGFGDFNDLAEVPEFDVDIPRPEAVLPSLRSSGHDINSSEPSNNDA